MLNKMIAIGNLGTDPEMKCTPNGNAVTNFRLAVSRSYTNSSGQKQTDTEWFTVVCWNQLAESCNTYLSRSAKVLAERRLKSKTWTGIDGQIRFSNEIVASQVLFLDRRGDGNGEFSESGVTAERDIGLKMGECEKVIK